MNAPLQTSERPTRAEFDSLLTAYEGALDHARWCKESGQPRPTYERACDAAAAARRALENAACAPCPGCGMELK